MNTVRVTTVRSDVIRLSTPSSECPRTRAEPVGAVFTQGCVSTIPTRLNLRHQLPFKRRHVLVSSCPRVRVSAVFPGSSTAVLVSTRGVFEPNNVLSLTDAKSWIAVIRRSEPTDPVDRRPFPEAGDARAGLSKTVSGPLVSPTPDAAVGLRNIRPGKHGYRRQISRSAARSSDLRRAPGAAGSNGDESGSQGVGSRG